MTKIKLLADEMLEELEGAKNYAECYLEKKSLGETNWATKFKEMAEDELTHASYLHEMIVEKINKLKEVYTPPVEMMDKWEHDHKEYVEKAAWIKTMLGM